MTMTKTTKPPVARRRRCSSRWLGSGAPLPRTGSRRSPAPKNLPHGPSSSPRSHTSPPSYSAAGTGEAATPSPAKGNRTRQIQGSASPREWRARPRHPEKSRRRRGRAPPPTRRLGRTTSSRAPPSRYLDTLHYVQAANRRSPPSRRRSDRRRGRSNDSTASEVGSRVDARNRLTSTVAGG